MCVVLSKSCPDQSHADHTGDLPTDFHHHRASCVMRQYDVWAQCACNASCWYAARYMHQACLCNIRQCTEELPRSKHSINAAGFPRPQIGTPLTSPGCVAGTNVHLELPSCLKRQSAQAWTLSRCKHAPILSRCSTSLLRLAACLEHMTACSCCRVCRTAAPMHGITEREYITHI